MSEFLMVLLFSVFVSPELKMQLENLQDNEKITVIVVMNIEYPFAAVENLPVKEKADIFKELARNSQQNLIDYLEQFPAEIEEIKQFWVFNGLHIRATKRLINSLMKRDDIKSIIHNGVIKLPAVKGLPNSRTPEWNISKVMADSCWNAGYTGDSILIGHLDTGCDFTHPALSGKWSGY